MFETLLHKIMRGEDPWKELESHKPKTLSKKSGIFTKKSHGNMQRRIDYWRNKYSEEKFNKIMIEQGMRY